jgi:hypothetical protein
LYSSNEYYVITNPLILEEQNSFKIIGTWAEQFSGMGINYCHDNME